MTKAKNPDAEIRSALSLHEAGQLEAAKSAYRSILDRHPHRGSVWHNLGVTCAETGASEEAIVCFSRAVDIDPGYVSAHFNLGTALAAAGRHDSARVAYLRAVSLEPDLYDAHRALGFSWQAAGRSERALDHFDRTLDLRRGEGRIGIADNILHSATRLKLEHDTGQFRYLASQPRPRKPFEMYARSFAETAASLGDGVIDLSGDQLEAMGGIYNTPWHMVDAPEADTAVSPELDFGDIEASFAGSGRGSVWFDGFLSPRALSFLQRFLLGSMIWSDFRHIDGFLAAYLEDGLACPLVLQIARETRAAFPEIIGDRVLIQSWAFKGLDPSLPIPLHSDDAEISLNFWVTPGAANLVHDRGGLVLCDGVAREPGMYMEDPASAPSGPRGQQRIPYRENRAVLFDSRLLHGSDAPEFAAGYENRRINITMLFGKIP